MKRTLLVAIALACLLAPAAFATITLTATPGSQGPVTAGQTFTITLSLSITSSPPPDMEAIDIVFEGLATQNAVSINNLFSVTGRTVNSGLGASWTSDASGGDLLTTTGSDHSGYVQTNSGGDGGNEGLTAGSSSDFKSTPFTNLTLGTWTFTIGSGTPTGTYNFGTTLLATSPSKFSDVGSTQSSTIPGAFGTWPISNSAAFSIMVTAVPEPTTWSLLGLGGVGALGMVMLRRRRA